MQPLIKFVFSIAACFVFNIYAAAQTQTENKYRAVHWSLDEGLSQGETYSIIKDKNGFLWIGTRYGLNRFDGNKFKIYLHERNDNHSLISNRVINGLVEDSLHNIWIGSEDKGVSRYNIKTDNFTNLYPDSAHQTIAPFWATKDKVFCTEGDYISEYNIFTLEKKKIATLNKYGTNFTVFDEGTNSVWCLAPNPKGNTMLLQVSLAGNAVKTFPLPHFSKSTYPDAEAMCFDIKRNCIWINSNEGLLQFTVGDKQFHHISTLSSYEHVKDYGRFVGITLDKQGRIWFATHPDGIIIYNPTDSSVTLPFSEDTVLQHETGYVNACIYCDRDNVIWSGFWLRKGIYQIIPFSPIVKTYVSSPKKDSLNGMAVVRAIDAGEGKIWVGTMNGINILDKKTNTFHLLEKKDLPCVQTYNGLIVPITIDTFAQKAWLSSEKGVFKIDMRTKKCIQLVFKTIKGRINSHAGVSFTDDGKEIFFVSEDDSSQHFYVLNLNSDTAEERISFASASFNIFYSVPIKNHLLFLQGRDDEKGNQTYENKKGNWQLIHTPIDSIRWTSIVFINETNSYWVAGEKLLFHFDKFFNLIKSYNQDNGMPELTVAGLINDNYGNIWFRTDRSIHELNVSTGLIIAMTESDGFNKQDFGPVPFVNKDADDNIYYSGGFFGNGLTKINPGHLISTVSSVYLKSLTINQKPFALNTGINDTDTLSLKYNQTKIEIETGIIDLYSKGKSRIRYKLQGNAVNENWQYAPYYYTIRYDGLPPGDYQLVMQASNASNEFNGPEKILSIHISAPFWNTLWFRIIAVLIFAAAVYAFIQYRSRNLKRKNVILEEKVMHRTKELKYSLEELRSTQAQLIQSEKMASLGELTAGIAHEIQNPLNFVNNFSEVSRELLDEMKTELTNDNKEEANAIAEDVKQNLEKVIFHGKRADAIVKGMLQHSRSSNGVKELTDINALCDEYLRLSYHGLRAKDKNFNAELITNFEKSIGKINLVPQDIGRVLLNLYNNAFYAVSEQKKRQTEAYKPKVSVSTKKTYNGITISVQDNGKGIPQKDIDRIFQPFFTTKPTGQGTGLGLSLSYDIVKAHGGEIKVQSKENEGTQFIVLLPLAN